MINKIINQVNSAGIQLFLEDGELKFKAPKGALTAELKAVLVENKAEIIQRLENDENYINRLKNEDAGHLLSYKQKRLWTQYQSNKKHFIHNWTQVFSLKENFDKQIIQVCFEQIIQRHEIFRTTYDKQNDEPKQIINDSKEFTIDEIDISNLPDQNKALSELVKILKTRVFDLTIDCMLHVTLVKSEQEYYMITTCHPIATDERSQKLLIKEFSHLYNVTIDKKNESLKHNNIQYVDYAYWHNQFLNGVHLNNEITYWEKQLNNAPKMHQIPTDFTRSLSLVPGSTESYETCLPKIVNLDLKLLAQKHDVSLSTVLHAAFFYLVSVMSRQKDIVIGMPVTGRTNQQLENLQGQLANDLALRIKIDTDVNFIELIKQLEQKKSEALHHQTVPFDKLVELLNIDISTGHQPIFQLCFLHINTTDNLSLENSILREKTDYQQSPCKYDLKLTVHESHSETKLDWQYSSQLFENSSVINMSGLFDNLLNELISQSNISLDEINLIDDAMHRQLLSWGEPLTQSTNKQLIHQRFERQVEKSPHSIALNFDDLKITYHQLNSMANKLSGDLIAECPLNDNTKIGVVFPRSIEMVVAILAILKSGAAYVPIDNNYPDSRVDNIIDNSSLSAILTTSSAQKRFEKYVNLCINITFEQLLQATSEFDYPNPELTIDHSALAYVIYTSGSTGKPKGVEIEHRQAARLFYTCDELYQFNQNDVWCLFHSISFDFSVWELWGALCNGAQLVIANEDEVLDQRLFLDLLENHSVNILNHTPSAFYQLQEQALIQKPQLTLRHIIFGGEALDVQKIKPWFSGDLTPQVQFSNMYGITETTVHTTHCFIDVAAQHKGSVIGRKLADLSAFVCDEQLRLLPQGVVGELYIGGAGVARGYCNQVDLTAERFIPNPFMSGDRLYRTGDLVRWLANGQLEYHGRIDNQVKIRGFRIELGEIEQVISNDADQVNNAVIVEESPAQRLIAYVCRSNSMDDESLMDLLKKALSSNLPEYMRPTEIVLIDHLPLTANGKLDKKRLPGVKKDESNQIVLATTATEIELINMWSGLLGLDLKMININSDFFELGGHSLSAMKMVAIVELAFKCILTVKHVFEYPILKDLAIVIDQLEKSNDSLIPKHTFKARIPLSFAQQRLWFVDQLEGASAEYNITSAVQISGVIDLSLLERSINTIVQRHEILRTTYHSSDEGAYQVINDDSQFSLKIIDKFNDHNALTRYIYEEGKKSFSLASDLMMRATLFTLTENSSVLVMTVHHIAFDEWSLNILIKEISSAYHSLLNNKPIQNIELPIQYADFAVWQRQQLSHDNLAQLLNYWKNALTDIPELHSLPLDKKRPEKQNFDGELFVQSIDSSIVDELMKISHQQQTTMFMTVQTILALLLARFSNTNDVVMGTPLAGRTKAQVNELIGFFINSVVLRTTIDYTVTFAELLQQSKKYILDAFKHQDLPFELLVDELKPARDLSFNPIYQISFSYHNIDIEPLEMGDLQFKPISNNISQVKYDLEIHARMVNKSLEITWIYAKSLFEEETIENLAQSLEGLMRSIIAEPAQTVGKHKYLNSCIEKQLLENSNQLTVKTEDYKTIHELFEAQVELTPEKVAVNCDGETLTYDELNKQANKLAHFLISQGIKNNDLIAICAERSVEFVIAIYAVLKAGGGYLPIDVNLPEQRVDQMLSDSCVKVVILQMDYFSSFSFDGKKTIPIDQNMRSVLTKQHSNLNPQIVKSDSAQHLAYVIYSSGSTGTPKGIEISHSALIASILSRHNYYKQPMEGLMSVSSVSFDASVIGFFWPLMCGSCLYMLDSFSSKDPNAILDCIEENNISHLVVTSQVYKNYLLLCENKEYSGPLRVVISGGEALEPKTHVLHTKLLWSNEAELYNEYGPTEATIWSSVYRCENDVYHSIPIGHSPGHCQLLVLSEFMQLLPFGVIGELYISGQTLARGYRNHSALTSEKFIEHERFGRIYRTGDLVRQTKDGNIHFMGRIDNQVKIRGYRIELEEIENCLYSCAEISSAKVIVDQDNGNEKLVAYVIKNNDVSNEDSNDFTLIKSVKATLTKSLPDYMVPSSIMIIDHFHLTDNGKVDFSKLPKPEYLSHNSYEAPQSAIEIQLVELWQTLLKQDEIGINDNFFEIGGDSILSIQLVSRANKAGIGITTKQLFKCQNIAELAKVAQLEPLNQSDAEIASGQITLLPIQRLFLEEKTDDQNHFNQSLLLHCPENLTHDYLISILSALYDHHDSLRLIFDCVDGQWHAFYRELTDVNINDACIEENIVSEDQKKYIESRCQYWQQQFDISTGPLFKAVLMRSQDKKVNRLFLVAHHLVVDGVSWRILLTDLQKCYEQIQSGQPINLGSKTASVKTWGNKLSEYIKSKDFEKERLYWENHTSELPMKLPINQKSISMATQSSTQYASIQLSEVKTTTLLQQCNQAYHTTINELLLAAVFQSFNQWTDSEYVSIYLESHGREAEFCDVDLTQTVGWFTSIFPLQLSCNDTQLTNVIASIKDQYRRIPNNGLGYGVMRYLDNSDFEKNKKHYSQVEFNYLGQFDQTINEQSQFKVAGESAGQAISEHNLRHTLIGLTGMVSNGRLRFDVDYSELNFKAEVIDQFAGLLLNNLEVIIDHCSRVEKSYYTPSDFSLAQVNWSDLQKWQDDYPNFSELYPATPMQAGMVFQSMLNSSAYVTQTYPLISGVIHTEAFKQAWQFAIDQYDVYRTCFVGMENVLHQLVQDKVELPWYYYDWSDLTETEQDKNFSKYLKNDKHKGFDLSHAPLIRVALFKLSDQSHRLLWTHHHSLTDGWCLPIIYNDVLHAYRALVNGESIAIQTKPSYKNYIRWLQDQHTESAIDFWQEKLEDISSPTPLMCLEKNNKVAGVHQVLDFRLDKDQTNEINNIARSLKVTVNTIVQYCWAFLLHRYSGENTIVFGATISGRPAEVSGIEEMVGLFINSIPVVVDFSQQTETEKALQGLHKEFQESCHFGYLPLVDIQRQSNINSGHLFESLLVFENYPVSESMEKASEVDDLLIVDFENDEQTEYGLTLLASCAKFLALRLSYQSDQFSEKSISKIADHLKQILLSLKNSIAHKVSPSMLTDYESNQLNLINDTNLPYISDACIHELVLKQAKSQPHLIACVCAGIAYDYQTLALKTRSLAAKLEQLGAKPNTLIAINIEKSFDQLVAMLAVMSSGSAYLPLNTDWPKAHKLKVIKNGKCSLLVGNDQESEHLAQDLDIICQSTDCEENNEYEFNKNVSPTDLAYVIFTSGSTGEPKGVMISHQNAINTMEHINKRFSISKKDCVFAISSIAFDLSVYDYFGPLMVGASVCIPTEDEVTDPSSWCRLVKTHQVTLWDSVPQLMQLAVEYAELVEDFDSLSSINSVMMSGDWIPLSLPERIRAVCPHASINSLGGATEGSIWSIIYPIKEIKADWRSIPYGKPLPNQKFYILDPHLNPCPYGITGELFIGGVGVAQGYWGNEELTNYRFPNDPITGERLYRTGDMGRFLEDGNIEFMGRQDDQVKIRGYRVELSEIEYYLNTDPELTDAVVLVRDFDKDSLLVAYVQTDMNVEQHDKLIKRLQELLSASLPAYMMPSAFVALKQMPLTTNGKLDKKALPMPEFKVDESFQGAHTPVEKQLVEIWQSVLGREKIGVLDNFFEIGGDSILSIQVTSRANSQGLYFTTRELFESQTIQKLSELVQFDKKVIISQEASQGKNILLPFQQHFLRSNTTHNQFNQSILLNLSSPIDENDLKGMTKLLYQRHDALRLIFKCEDKDWQAEYQPISEELISQSCLVEDLDDYKTEISARCEYWQKHFDIHTGPLLRIVMMRCTQENQYRLFLVAHHLIVDAVSWRIILSDLELMSQQLEEGLALELGSKTVSLQQWGTSIKEFSQSEELLSEHEYWTNSLSKPIIPLPIDYQQQDCGSAMSNKSINFEINANLTRKLLQKSNKVYHTTINELLLSAVSIGIKKWDPNQQAIRLIIEGHGRSDVMGDYDLSNTVGWFTNFYPLVLDCEDRNIENIILKTKEQFRAVPNSGFGYGLLKYICPESESIMRIKHLSEQPVHMAFNYLGQLDQVLSEKSAFSIAAEHAGSEMSDEIRRLYPLELNSMIINEQMRLSLGFSSELFDDKHVSELAEKIKQSLIDVINQCENASKGSYSPSDFPLANVSQSNINQWQEKYPVIQNIYPATAMQAGLLFHNLIDPSSYVTQNYPIFSGALDIELFRQAWVKLVARHEIYRTAFVGEIDDLQQLLLAEVELPWHTEDWSHLNEDEQANRFVQYREQDRIKGFDFSSAPLMRVALFSLKNDRFQMLFTHHHSLSDGWCMPILYNDLMEYYFSLVQNREAILAKVTPYVNYIEWLQKQPQDEAQIYWHNQLSDFDSATPLIYELPFQDHYSEYVEHSLLIDKVTTEKISRFAKENHTTINNILQFSWAYLLHKLSGQQQVVFGATIAGRPASLEGVDQMVGLFINTIPVIVDFSKNCSFSQHFKNLHTNFQESCEYGYLSLNEIQRQSSVQSGERLFNSIIVFENYPIEGMQKEINSVSDIQIEKFNTDERTDYALTISASFDKEFEIRLGYHKPLCSTEMIKRLASQLEQVFIELLRVDLSKNKNLSILPCQEVEQINQWQGEPIDVPSNISIANFFEGHVKKQENAIAVTDQDEQFTYKQIDTMANQLVHLLIEKGVSTQSVVGLMIPRGYMMVVSFIAIAKLKAIYVPINPSLPADRVQNICDAAHIEVFLSSHTLEQKLTFVNTELIQLDNIDLNDYPNDYKSHLAIKNDCHLLAYYIFTSGTTGTPKGVKISQKAIMASYLGWIDAYQLDTNEHCHLQMAELGFDVCIGDMVRSMCSGGHLVICDKMTLLDNKKLFELIKKHKVSIAEFVPVTLRHLLAHVEKINADLHNFKYLIVGSDVWYSDEHNKVLNYLSDTALLVNSYGLSECAVDSCYIATTKFNRLPSGMAIIGQPMKQARLYVLDPSLNQVPIAVKGELYIAGPGVGDGYLNLKNTADPFVDNPFEPGQKMYKTGDEVRWMHDGNLEYLGRKDQQIKIRGNRIELAEIESQILLVPEVSQAVVVENKAQKNQILVVYFTSKKPDLSEENLTNKIIDKLKQKLPDYMLPKAWLKLDKMPITNNGKIDRNNLPSFEFKPSINRIPPSSPIEIQLSLIWSDLLEIDEQLISADSNFFDIGGHSLLSIRLINEIVAVFACQLRIIDVFNCPDLATMAVIIETLSDSPTTEVVDNYEDGLVEEIQW